MANETPSRPPPPFVANAPLNFHFDYLTTSLNEIAGATSLISVGHLGRRQGHLHLHN